MFKFSLSISVERMTKGIMQSPGFPNKFGYNLDKEYTIQVTKGKVVHVVFSEFNLDSDSPCKDYLEIVDNNSMLLLRRSCGKKPPSEILSHTNRVNVFFRSDSLRTHQTLSRWRFTWEESKEIVVVHFLLYYIKLFSFCSCSCQYVCNLRTRC